MFCTCIAKQRFVERNQLRCKSDAYSFFVNREEINLLNDLSSEKTEDKKASEIRKKTSQMRKHEAKRHLMEPRLGDYGKVITDGI